MTIKNDASLESLKHFKLKVTPVADKRSIVRFGKARFSILKDRLIRCEYSDEAGFENAPSQHFWFRKQPYAPFTIKKKKDTIEIRTERLKLVYKETGKGFTPENLFIKVKETGRTWHYGDEDPENLHGTARTLDNCYADYDITRFQRIALSNGMISKSGWALVDDSESLVFDNYGFLRLRKHQNRDIYFFGHGLDYKACLMDYYAVSGNVRMVPKWSLGIWWSRWEKYRQSDLLRIAYEFEDHGVPLSVCVVDKDWHLKGWTGYTWNPEYFPDPKGFFDQMHSMGIRVCLNLHPSGGVAAHEKMYTRMALHMGVDPKTKETIPFDLTSKRFISGYFKYLHHPIEKDGCDFWWIDWQQGTTSKLYGLDPLWYLNHLHATDLARGWKKRPINFSRWGNYGSHRYPVGFSGDTIATWATLRYQIYFTATSSNAGYSWWSHDIGGFMQAIRDDELYTRWVQFGVFSPIFRFHNSGTPLANNKPWAKRPIFKEAAIKALKLRRQLLPYLYTSAWNNRCGKLPLIRPMYHEHPKENDAYNCPRQYYFGDDLIAAPYNRPMKKTTGVISKKIWFPRLKDNCWYDFFTGDEYNGGEWYSISGDIEKIPVFAKSGSIIPLEIENRGYKIMLFNGNGKGCIYDDDGISLDYKDGIYSLYECTNIKEGSKVTFTMRQVEGKLRQKKDIVLLLKGYQEFSRAVIKVNDGQNWHIMKSVTGEFRIEGMRYTGRLLKVEVNLKKINQ